MRIGETSDPYRSPGKYAAAHQRDRVVEDRRFAVGRRRLAGPSLGEDNRPLAGVERELVELLIRGEEAVLVPVGRVGPRREAGVRGDEQMPAPCDALGRLAQDAIARQFDGRVEEARGDEVVVACGRRGEVCGCLLYTSRCV